MNITVLGSGNGGCAVAFDCAAHGHQVSLFDFEQFPESIKAVQSNKGIYCEGELEGFQPVAYAGHEIEKALDGADIIYAVGPAYSTKPFAEVCKPFLKKGQIVIVCPSSCGGAIEFKNGSGLGIRDEEVLIAETSTLPYAVRLLEPGKIRIFNKLKGGLFMAAVPARNTNYILEQIRDVYPAMTAVKNVLQTSLQNGNPVIHPAITLMNVALIERTDFDFDFYHDGVTPAVGRLIEAVDMERIAIGKKLGVDVIPDPELGVIQGYMLEATYDKGFATAPGFDGVKAHTSLDYRYFNEDVGYGLVFLQKLGEQIGVGTPVISAVITLVSQLMNRDYLDEAKRTMKTLGLSNLTVSELGKLLA
ncbi:MAG: opine dehydrogenase [Desulfobacula sp.]|jgi:opine dehydrogenase|uniref:NAD/NADP octopine/nopaline dehydrogenase family protein n=1 Tax=Desulfobacula sp. TaxID=2593537 RepID=UPI001DB7720D|nr:opine dehydrogenase [Desulfobacula sp.]MBT3484591.1 opine dehydrogenase [Desulfobacula sp.]MBT3803961.1 opine dehydrogenase [Desulfobacula sp.]MBT4023576.1 opine dehydrogenase [Desulfobacula sp.]MBT4197756.1 opine dehydrogenase [Desulfobacula sp.]